MRGGCRGGGRAVQRERGGVGRGNGGGQWYFYRGYATYWQRDSGDIFLNRITLRKVTEDEGDIIKARAGYYFCLSLSKRTENSGE